MTMETTIHGMNEFQGWSLDAGPGSEDAHSNGEAASLLGRKLTSLGCEVSSGDFPHQTLRILLPARNMDHGSWKPWQMESPSCDS